MVFLYCLKLLISALPRRRRIYVVHLWGEGDKTTKILYNNVVIAYRKDGLKNYLLTSSCNRYNKWPYGKIPSKTKRFRCIDYRINLLKILSSADYCLQHRFLEERLYNIDPIYYAYIIFIAHEFYLVLPEITLKKYRNK